MVQFVKLTAHLGFIPEENVVRSNGRGMDHNLLAQDDGSGNRTTAG
jgi:hypothetical protein